MGVGVFRIVLSATERDEIAPEICEIHKFVSIFHLSLSLSLSGDGLQIRIKSLFSINELSSPRTSIIKDLPRILLHQIVIIPSVLNFISNLATGGRSRCVSMNTRECNMFRSETFYAN